MKVGRPKKIDKKKSFTVMIEESLQKELKDYARKVNKKPSIVVYDAFLEWFEKNKKIIIDNVKNIE